MNWRCADKTFGDYIVGDDVSGADLNGNALLSRVSAAGNPTLSMLSLSAVAIPASGYLGQVNLSVSRALTSSEVLEVLSASTAGDPPACRIWTCRRPC